MNQVHLVGTLAFDPRIKFFDSGKSKATCLVAAQAPGRQYPDKVDVAAWDDQGQQLGDMKQGDAVEIFGRITTESWDDRSTGKKVYKTVVIAESVATPAQVVQQGQPQRQAPARRQPAARDEALPF
jgi:single-strand DNA-binding protein